MMLVFMLLGCFLRFDPDPHPPDDTHEVPPLTGDRFSNRKPVDTGDTGPPEDPRPNILVVISDDIGVEASACYEGLIDAERAPQPTIEGLCADGLTFTDAWSYPLCSPTRAAMMTGRYGWQTGVGRAIDEKSGAMSADEETVVDLIDIEQSAYIGKWHLAEEKDYTHPNELGWSHFSGTLSGAVDDYFAYEKVVDGVPEQVNNYATTEVVDDALAWIADHDSAPWVVWVGFNAPHTPLHAPPDDLHSYDLTKLDSATEPTPFFQAMIESMDTEFGRLLDGVDRKDTIVIYLGDNGSMSMVNQDIYPEGHGKNSLGEGGLRIPLIISGPGIPKGEVESMVHVVDLYATILDLTETEAKDTPGIDSLSLLPYIQDPAAAPHRELMLAELFGMNVPESLAGRAARTEQYKLLRIFAGLEQFYDLEADPTGSTNLLEGEEKLSEEAEAAYTHLSDYLDQIDAKAGH